MPTSLIVGTFGSGKTTRLLEHARAAVTQNKHVLFIVPSPWHAAQIEDDVPARLLPGHTVRQVHVSWPSQLASTQDDTFLRLFDVFLLDNVDAVINGATGMFTVSTRVLALAQLYPTIEIVGTARGAVAGWPDPCETLNTSIRMQKNNHGELLRALLTPRALSNDTITKVSVYAYTQDAAQQVWSQLMGAVPDSTVILCNDENVFRGITDQQQAMNIVRVRQGQQPLGKLKMFTISNFMGCESRFTLLILKPQDTLADVVEGMTRHTERLALFFQASAPPAALCTDNAAHILGSLLPSSTFVNWAPRSAQVSVKKLALQICQQITTYDQMVQALAERLGAPRIVSVKRHTIYSEHKPIPQTVKCNAATLGTVVEHIAAECFGFATPLRQDKAFDLYDLGRAIAEGGWWSTEQETAVWQHSVGVQEPVSHHYFSAVCNRVLSLKNTCLTTPFSAYQVPVKFAANNVEIVGCADFVGNNCVLELKHTETLSLAAFAQTIVYMHALNVGVGYVFNVRTNHLEQLLFTAS